MTSKPVWKLFWLFILASNPAAFAATIVDPCSGPSALLNMVDRPSNSDSACVVPYKQSILELGYQYQKLTHSAGYQQNLPQAELRLGLPLHNELVFLFPSSIRQTVKSHTGASATAVGLKHEIGYNQDWLAAVETILTIPGGSAAYGNKGAGAAFNLIANLTINPQYNLTFMLGSSTQTQSSSDGGKRYHSINPDIVLTYTYSPNINFYGEVYGQTKTGPGQGDGVNFDGGIICLLVPTVTVDVEVGQRIKGNLNGFSHYIGAGLAVELG